ncbi:MAG: hypothetical protein IPL39_20900 [Opitutaceae bacterium]|nr:hypothetical protein [Opitutaceae bacterium]
MSRSLLALRQKAATEPKHRFRSLYRMIDLPRRSYNWTTFEAMWQTLGLPVPRIVETPYQAQCLLPLPSWRSSPAFCVRALLTSPVREYRTPGSARGASGNWRSYINGKM